MRRVDLPALVQVAAVHAQFETIHPFVDGNGRTGRALAHAMLRNKGLTTHTTVPLSAGLLVDTESYFSALTDATVVRALDVLVERGVLIERTEFSRNRVWEHPGILSVLDSYALRIRRGV